MRQLDLFKDTVQPSAEYQRLQAIPLRCCRDCKSYRARYCEHYDRVLSDPGRLCRCINFSGTESGDRPASSTFAA